MCLGSNFVLPPSSSSKVDAGKPETTLYQASSITSTSSPDAVFANGSIPCGADSIILKPKGRHHPWYSLCPLIEGGCWAAVPGKYMTTKCNDEPVFKIHPGLATIALTDHASGKWFFDQPDTVLDRQVRSCGVVRLVAANPRFNALFLPVFSTHHAHSLLNCCNTELYMLPRNRELISSFSAIISTEKESACLIP